MKKLVSLLLTFALLASLAACRPEEGQPADNATRIRIGVSVYDQYDTFISLLTERFNHYLKEKENTNKYSFTLIFESADGSQVIQNNQVDTFLSSGCDLLCINLVDRTDVSSIVNKAETAGVPVLFFNRELVPADIERSQNLYYVGAESKVSGQLQGQLVADLFAADKSIDRSGDGSLQYVMLEGEAGHQDAIFRTQYSIETLRAKGVAVERLDGAIANWSRAVAETKMSQWLDKYPPGSSDQKNMEVVLANNDDMALGAIDALEKADIERTDWPLIVGIDGTREGLEAVKGGKMAATVFNDADGQARALVEMACWLRGGGTLPSDIRLQDGKYVRLPYRLVLPSNVDQYIALYAK